jgi:hypothetical protein
MPRRFSPANALIANWGPPPGRNLYVSDKPLNQVHVRPQSKVSLLNERGNALREVAGTTIEYV